MTPSSTADCHIEFGMSELPEFKFAIQWSNISSQWFWYVVIMPIYKHVPAHTADRLSTYVAMPNDATDNFAGMSCAEFIMTILGADAI
jgi:hypothetical protein